MTDQQTTDPRTAQLEARIAELEKRVPRESSGGSGKTGFETAFWAMMHTVFPDEARKHLKVAGREQLLAARVDLDRWIARLDEQEAASTSRPHEKIDIE